MADSASGGKMLAREKGEMVFWSFGAELEHLFQEAILVQPRPVAQERDRSQAERKRPGPPRGTRSVTGAGHNYEIKR